MLIEFCTEEKAANSWAHWRDMTFQVDMTFKSHLKGWDLPARKGGHRGPLKVWKVVGCAEEMRFPQLEHDCAMGR